MVFTNKMLQVLTQLRIGAVQTHMSGGRFLSLLLLETPTFWFEKVDCSILKTKEFSDNE